MDSSTPQEGEPEETAGTGSREKNTHARREALVQAAYRLFLAKGFHATTMDEVAAEAGLSRRTAFRYFATKEELVFPEMKAREARIALLLVPLEGETGFETVRRACLTMAREYQLDRERLLAQWAIVNGEPSLEAFELGAERSSQAAFEQVLARGQRESARSTRRARIHAVTISAAIRATLHNWLSTGASLDLVRLGRETFSDLEHGFAHPHD